MPRSSINQPSYTHVSGNVYKRLIFKRREKEQWGFHPSPKNLKWLGIADPPLRGRWSPHQSLDDSVDTKDGL